MGSDECSTVNELEVTMSSSASPLRTKLSQDCEVWDSLKHAISLSSGFQRWQLEQQIEKLDRSATLDALVSCYLKETLETLAY